MIRLVRHRLALWPVFLLVHLWLSVANIVGNEHPLGDVTLVYKTWMQQGFDTHVWVGIDSAWVYPIVAIVPMLLAWVFGPDAYALTWLAIVTALDAVAFGFLVGWHRNARNTVAAWWWLAFLTLLGPIAVARIDTISVPLAVVGVLFLATRPRMAGALLTVAAWMKVWPGALLIAAVVATRQRWQILLAALAASVVVVVAAVAVGGGAQVFSFVGQQAGRGLQIEAPVSTPWLWQAFAGVPQVSIFFNRALLTFQVTGGGVDAIAELTTPLMLLAILAIVLVAVLAVRNRGSSIDVLPALTLALVTALIAFNKVGSPQYITWLAVPVILGLVTSASAHGRSFRTPAILVAIIATLTQLIYPFLYDALLALHPVPLIVLTVRNLMLFVLLGWAMFELGRVGRTDNVCDDFVVRDSLMGDKQER
ncbi:MAG: hypothetical protein ABI053_06035 [Lacisediminihabitans sp.]